MANDTMGTPFTKEAMLAELEKLPEPERIALRTRPRCRRAGGGAARTWKYQTQIPSCPTPMAGRL